MPCETSSRSTGLPTLYREAEDIIGWKELGKLQITGGGEGVDRIRRGGMMVIGCKNE